MVERRMDKWDRRFMELVDTVAGWSSCFQENRQMGAVIVKNKRIMTTGYNGAPSGIPSCKEKGECMRRRLGIPSGQQGQLCYAIHAEQNALIQAARMGIAIEGATLYCTHRPCSICARLIINAGIVRIVYRNPYPDDFSLAILNEASIMLEQYQESAGPTM
jgi:dCMP deaminase